MKKQNPTHVVSDAPHSKPDAEEIVSKTKAVAVYPADVALQKNTASSSTPTPPSSATTEPGIDQKSGPVIKDFHPGERVIGAARPLPADTYKYAAFQYHVVLSMPLVAKTPPGANYSDATVSCP